MPDRGWGYLPVRVCRPCYDITDRGQGTQGMESNEVQVRKVGETVYGTVSSLATALEFPISILKDSARPDYWVPDHEISACAVCDREIGVPAPGTQVIVTQPVGVVLISTITHPPTHPQVELSLISNYLGS